RTDGDGRGQAAALLRRGRRPGRVRARDARPRYPDLVVVLVPVVTALYEHRVVLGGGQFPRPPVLVPLRAGGSGRGGTLDGEPGGDLFTGGVGEQRPLRPADLLLQELARLIRRQDIDAGRARLGDAGVVLRGAVADDEPDGLGEVD